jgi:hypothetical protein
VADVPITTYSPEIDFDFGTTSDEGIEVVELQTAVEELGPDPAEYLDDALGGSNEIDYSQYDDEYEEESVTSYQPDNIDIPIVVQEAPLGVEVSLPSYDPVVLLVGTPVRPGRVGSFGQSRLALIHTRTTQPVECP